MAAAELTASACPARPASSHAARSARALPREFATAAAAVLALTGAAVLAGALDPALAGGGHPHPTLTGTVGDASSILTEYVPGHIFGLLCPT